MLERATRIEGAAGRHVHERGWKSGDAAQLPLLVEGRKAVDQEPGIGVAWLCQQLLDRTDLDESPCVHHAGNTRRIPTMRS
jgi:hypothetical protein